MALGMPQTAGSNPPQYPSRAASVAANGGGAARGGGGTGVETWRANGGGGSPQQNPMSISEQVSRGMAGGGTGVMPQSSPPVNGQYGLYGPKDISAGNVYAPPVYRDINAVTSNIPAGSPAAISYGGPDYNALSRQQAATDAYLAQLANGGKALDASYAAQKEALASRGDIEKQRYGQQTGNLRTDIGYQGQLLGNALNRDVNMGREENAQRLQQATDLFGRQGALLQKDWSYNLDQEGRAGSARDLATGYYNATYGNALKQADFAKTSGLNQNRSASAAHGSYASTGNAQNIGDIGTRYGLTTQSAADAHNYNLGQANQQYDATIGGLKNAWNQRDAQYQNETAGYQGAVQLSNQTTKHIDSIAADYGIKQQQLQAALNSGLANLGYNRDNVLNQLDQAVKAKDTEQISAAMNLIQMGVSAAGPSFGGGSSGFASFGTNGPTNVNVTGPGSTTTVARGANSRAY